MKKKEYEIRELHSHIDQLIRQIGDLCQEEDRRPSLSGDEPETVSVHPSRDRQLDLFCKTLSALMPNTKLVGGTMDVLWGEIDDPTDVLKELSGLQGKPGETVEGAAPWKERRLRDLRIYFRNFGQGKCEALLGRKKTQQRDIEWLKKH